MTNYLQARYNGKRGGNIKETQPARRTKAQRQTEEDKWAAAGFIMTDWNKMTYTWPGQFPTFIVAPGIVTNDQGIRAGLVARYAPADKEILFAYGTDPAVIKDQLDDEILEIMRLQADTADPITSDFIPFMGEPVTVVVDGQEIGPEISF